MDKCKYFQGFSGTKTRRATIIAIGFLCLTLAAAGRCNDDDFKWGSTSEGLRLGFCLDPTENEIAVRISNSGSEDKVTRVGFVTGRAVLEALRFHLTRKNGTFDIFAPGNLYVAGRMEPLFVPILSNGEFTIRYLLSDLRFEGRPLDKVLVSQDRMHASLVVGKDECSERVFLLSCWTGVLSSGEVTLH